mmetsp:Transcript_38770/g.80521  ORF Transcript_38770/g.80521 Transcript_38770/m.80521 type:complete len:204 (-) Transcript_38770:2295-2906(-)
MEVDLLVDMVAVAKGTEEALVMVEATTKALNKDMTTTSNNSTEVISSNNLYRSNHHTDRDRMSSLLLTSKMQLQVTEGTSNMVCHRCSINKYQTWGVHQDKFQITEVGRRPLTLDLSHSMGRICRHSSHHSPRLLLRRFWIQVVGSRQPHRTVKRTTGMKGPGKRNGINHRACRKRVRWRIDVGVFCPCVCATQCYMMRPISV